MIKNKITYLLFMAIGGLSLQQAAAQVTVVTDNANNGQYKRMVYNQWNDWQPTPNTNWLGIPKNLSGWTYWRVIHHDYWNGQDQRPWKAGGQFNQNYVSLLAQQNLEEKIKDTANAMMQIYASTDISMSGGALDIPYQVYFKKAFDDKFNEVEQLKQILQNLSPGAYTDMLNSTYGKDYMERLDIMKDRISTINNAYVDRGARIVSYCKIMTELQPLVMHAKAFIYAFINVAALPPPSTYKPSNNPPPKLNISDKEIVDGLLKNWKGE